MKQFLIGAGGTGAMAIRSYLCILAALSADPNTPPLDEIFIRLVDMDYGSDAAMKCKELFDYYNDLKEKCSLFPQVEFEIWDFTMAVRSSVAQNGITMDENKAVTLRGMVTPGSGVPSDHTARLMETLYTDAELDKPLDKGFYGHPNIGSTVFNYVSNDFLRTDDSSFMKNLQAELADPNALQHPVPVYLFGSLFGGTGASVIPNLITVLRSLEDGHGTALGDETRMKLGVCMLMPYFKTPPITQEAKAAGIHPDDSKFMIQTREALRYYGEFGINNKVYTFAKLCLDIAERGKEKLKQTFNGEYFVQQFDRKNKAFLEPFSAVHDRPLYDGEMGEISYQLGDACGIDQVLADYHTALCGLAPVFDPHQRKKALESIYRFNFLSMEDMHNPCRVFALNREKGVRMFAWPGNAEKPQIPILYADETMTGFEYAVADNMLGVGMEAEALEIVAAVRARYDGSRRNPLSELECGSSYARAMASYSFLLTYSGFVYDLSEKKLGFKPLRNGCFFWSIDGAWGKVSCEDKQVAFTVLYGEVCLKQFVLYLEKVKEVYLNGKPCDFVQCGDTLTLTATLKANGEILFKEQF